MIGDGVFKALGEAVALANEDRAVKADLGGRVGLGGVGRSVGLLHDRGDKAGGVLVGSLHAHLVKHGLEDGNAVLIARSVCEHLKQHTEGNGGNNAGPVLAHRVHKRGGESVRCVDIGLLDLAGGLCARAVCKADRERLRAALVRGLRGVRGGIGNGRRGGLFIAGLVRAGDKGRCRQNKGEHEGNDLDKLLHKKQLLCICILRGGFLLPSPYRPGVRMVRWMV